MELFIAVVISFVLAALIGMTLGAIYVAALTMVAKNQVRRIHNMNLGRVLEGEYKVLSTKR